MLSLRLRIPISRASWSCRARFLLLAAFFVVPGGGTLARLAFPGPDPGPATVESGPESLRVTNSAIAVGWRWDGDGGLRPDGLGAWGKDVPLSPTGEVFEILLTDGRRYPASAFRRAGPVRVTRHDGESGEVTARLVRPWSGGEAEVALRSPDRSLAVVWRVLLVDGASAVRQELELTAIGDSCPLGEIRWFHQVLPGARTEGRVDGSPVVAEPFFVASEDPQAINAVIPEGAGGRIVCRLRREAALAPGETLGASFVIGVAPEGQMRRAFLHYLERERAHPYRPYLHYNSWYDIAWDPFALNETNCLEAIRRVGEHLVRAHAVVVDGMVFDDGWDNPRSLWQFHAGFPRGFAPLARACGEYGSRLGVWLSPFGGYGPSRDQRLRFGSAQGYETNATGFSLAGPRCYAAFKDACVGMIRRYGVNHFKFDGLAAGMYANGGAEYVRDTEAMRRLMLELRREDPGLYINLTTGSWPSPFWLRYADSVWRQGGDMGHAGKGSRQRQWLTYRDQETYRNIVGKGPLFPLNALMTQGVAYSRHGTAGDPTFTSEGFKEDVHAFFGSGTSLQELYLQPDRLAPEDWRVLAEAARWSRAHADVLVDTHWVGGDPGKLEIGGFASWSPRMGIVSLRNPDDQPRDFLLDVGRAFELPVGAATRYALRPAWPDDAGRPTLIATAGAPLRLTLPPFNVSVLEATPLPPAGPESGVEPASDADETAILPLPASLEPRPGRFPLGPGTRIRALRGAEQEARNLAEALRGATGLGFSLATGRPGPGEIRLALQPEIESHVGREGYRLQVTPEIVDLEAAGEAGLFYGGITLRQFLPAAAFASVRGETRTGWSLPGVAIEDRPRFGWRGLLLDPARHFLPPADVKRFIDLMALHKFNSLQLHLTDDQGWRLEIRKYPRLTEVGSVRSESPRRGNREAGDGLPYGPFFYTQDEIRDLVAYAAARHVTLVPEIEMPGHFRAALAAHPEFSCTGGPFEVRTRWGVEPDILCPGKDAAVTFVLEVLEEVIALFPGTFIHIGGDEAPRDRWKACGDCQARMRAEGLHHEAQLQTWLNRRVEEFLTARGRRLVGWDEILEGGLTPRATVMSWRGVEGGIAAAEAGHEVIMAPTSHTYFDYAQATGPGEPESIGGFIPLRQVYAFEPIPPTLASARHRHILGAQAQLWSEYLWNLRDVEYFAFPRAAALAEVLWSPAERRDFGAFRTRLRRHVGRLEALGVHYRRGGEEADAEARDGDR